MNLDARQHNMFLYMGVTTIGPEMCKTVASQEESDRFGTIKFYSISVPVEEEERRGESDVNTGWTSERGLASKTGFQF